MKKRDNDIKTLFVTPFKVNYEVLRDLFSAAENIIDETVAAIADSRAILMYQ